MNSNENLIMEEVTKVLIQNVIEPIIPDIEFIVEDVSVKIMTSNIVEEPELIVEKVVEEPVVNNITDLEEHINQDPEPTKFKFSRWFKNLWNRK
jgi:hypothetical protein